MTGVRNMVAAFVVGLVFVITVAMPYVCADLQLVGTLAKALSDDLRDRIDYKGNGEKYKRG